MVCVVQFMYYGICMSGACVWGLIVGVTLCAGVSMTGLICTHTK